MAGGSVGRWVGGSVLGGFNKTHKNLTLSQDLHFITQGNARKLEWKTI